MQIKVKNKEVSLTPPPQNRSFVLFLKSIFDAIFVTDPRIPIAILLFSYLVLGFTVLGFNRTPIQAFITTSSACLLELFLARIFRKKWIFPFSAMITSFSLSILLNYSHDYYLLLIPVFFAIASKYLLTFNDRHIFNPAQVAVSLSLMFVSTLITSSPAYQWNGISSMGAFIAGFGMFIIVPQVKRFPLVASFLFFFTLQILFRAWLMKHHLPFETLFLGTITSPAFFLFTFFMITDPATSPKKYSHQIILGFFLALFDLAFHLKQSYHTFFYAGFTIQLLRLVYLHLKAMLGSSSVLDYAKTRFLASGYWKRLVFLTALSLSSVSFYQNIINPSLPINNLALKFEEVLPQVSGINSELGDVFQRVDPRAQHLAKWLMSVGDSVAVGDFDGDGLQDLFFTNTLKRDTDRNALYKNLGDFKFQRVPIPVIKTKSKRIELYGMPSNALFVDFDNDHDLDLLITYAFGNPIFLKNQLKETGVASFSDDSHLLGKDYYTNSVTANFFDMNNDGTLDLIMGNVWPKNLPDYPQDNPQRLNLFKLPPAEYKGDIRMFNFMHESWHMADNGGVNDIFLQDSHHRFIKQDSAKLGLPEHFWSLAIGTGDLNKDGWTDLYIANDFGPDNLYYNQSGRSFKKIEGKIFGSIGKDTYKGMNASIVDFDGNGWLDVYISNVHHELQAEGSLLWMFKPGLNKHEPQIVDEATKRGALNENRFGWGAAAVDFNNDGYIDIAQANGMVDDTIDKKFETCPDYWYVNEKIARSAPEIHRYIHYWGDIRGFCIYGKELNRLYLGSGEKVNSFTDVAERIGMDKKTNSRGMAAADLNNDGKMDLIVTHQFHNATIYQNKLNDEVKRNWVGLDLKSTLKDCNSMAIGSSVEISYQDSGMNKKIFKEVQLVNGFSAQNDLRIHTGLGNSGEPVNIKINWCGKHQREYKKVAINQYHSLTL